MPSAGFEPRDPSNRNSADLRFRPDGQRDWPKNLIIILMNSCGDVNYTLIYGCDLLTRFISVQLFSSLRVDFIDIWPGTETAQVQGGNRQRGRDKNKLLTKQKKNNQSFEVNCIE